MSDLEPKNLEVAVTVVRRNDSILAGYNRGWGAFTLPMTKRRRWADPKRPDFIKPENWEDAAIRNVVEWFGKSTTNEPELLVEVREFRQSDRDLVVRDYYFQVFHMIVNETQQPIEGTIAEWLSPSDFLDVRRRPISPTARYLIGELQRKNKI